MKNTYTAIASTCVLTIVGVLLVISKDAREVSVSAQSQLEYASEGKCGNSWEVVPSPNDTGYDNYLLGIEALSAEDLEVVRYNIDVGGQSHLAQTPTSTPTHTPSRTPTHTVTGTPPTSTNTPTPTQTPTPADTPTARPTGCVVQTLLQEGFEGGSLGAFTSEADPATAPGWQPVTDYTHTGAYSAFAPDIPTYSRQWLTLTQPVPIPTGIAQATLSFWHRYSFELPDYDCGWLYLSTDGGSNWLDPSPYFITGAYNVLCRNDEFPTMGWGGNTQGQFLPVQLDLTSFAGQNLSFWFLEFTDASIGVEGWWVDDIELSLQYSCSPDTPSPTVTPVSTGGTSTPVLSTTPIITPTSTPQLTTATPTACLIEFTDVPEGSTFYSYIRCLACRGIISGYDTGCETGNPCFRPANNVTRGQLSKIIANAADFQEMHTEQTFADVSVGSTFYQYIERMASRGIISGYACGGVGEPCDGENRPYFRPQSNATRGQIAKVDVLAAVQALGWTLDDPPTNTFEDVAVGSTFYEYVETAYAHEVLNGYPCGEAGEPCGPDNKPYFRPNNNASRGQTSKIVSNTFYPGCSP